jgi:D-sedoheptulose 7-phosphate isomerase
MTRQIDTAAIFAGAMAEHIKVITSLRDLEPLLHRAAEAMVTALKSGHKIFWCGNGGSAADSQHMAAELVGRFRRERKALPSIALTTNSSIVTALGNDYGYDVVFQRQVEALAAKGDVLVGISTSGNSKNVCGALEQARKMGVFSIAMTGADGGRCAEIAELALRMPSRETPRIQEAHTLCAHMICDYVESAMCLADNPDARC